MWEFVSQKFYQDMGCFKYHVKWFALRNITTIYNKVTDKINDMYVSNINYFLYWYLKLITDSNAGLKILIKNDVKIFTIFNIPVAIFQLN